MRLTKEIRENIIDAAMHKAFDDRDKAHHKAAIALADAVYANEYGKIERAARRLPPEFINYSNRIKIDAAGFSWRGHHSGQMNNCLRMSKTRPMPHYFQEIKIGGAHPLNDQAQAVAEEYQAIERDKSELRTKLNALVYSVTTVPRLLEAWPECEKFLPATAPKSTALVPVELVPEVNAALGIKPKRRAA